MSAEFLKLPDSERKDILNAAAPKLNMLPEVVEKDVWVCWVLDVLFSIPDRRPMVFKGGTSLSKVFGLINRFSEDIVNFLDDYGGKEISKTKAHNIRDELESKLQEYKEGVLLKALKERASADGLELAVELGDSPWEIHVNYKSVLATFCCLYKNASKGRIEQPKRN